MNHADPHPASTRSAASDGPTPVLLFPGQSAYARDMLEVAADVPGAGHVQHASDAIGFDLSAAVADTAQPDNRLIQVGVFVANHIRLSALRAAGVSAGLGAGMSLGEYNHLVDIGALDFAAAVRLVDARGRLYDAGPGGVMAAVFPIDAAAVERTIARLGAPVAISNFNSPTQQVIAGPAGAVEQICRALDEEHFVDARIIERRLPMHSPLFAPVAPRLRRVLEDTPLRRPERPYVSNVLGGPAGDATGDDIRQLLTDHVHRPVRWKACVDWLAAEAPDPIFVEVGPRRILSNLMRRPWRSEPCHTTSTVAELEATVRALESA